MTTNTANTTARQSTLSLGIKPDKQRQKCYTWCQLLTKTWHPMNLTFVRALKGPAREILHTDVIHSLY